MATYGRISAHLATYGARGLQANQLQRAALEVIAFQTPPSKHEELRRVFVDMDTDDSGSAS